MNKNHSGLVERVAMSVNIRKALLADITDRRGWRQEWDMFDDDVKQEIRETFDKIILTALNKPRFRE